MRAFAIAGSLALLGLLGIAPPARAADQKTYTAALSAAEETPPGPDGGTGTATITIDMAAKSLCYDLSWSKEVGTPTNGHIHKGPKGVSGPIVVQFDVSQPKGCLQVDGAVLSQIESDPPGYYVNLHNNRYPTGAVRGQLKAS